MRAYRIREPSSHQRTLSFDARKSKRKSSGRKDHHLFEKFRPRDTWIASACVGNGGVTQEGWGDALLNVRFVGGESKEGVPLGAQWTISPLDCVRNRYPLSYDSWFICDLTRNDVTYEVRRVSRTLSRTSELTPTSPNLSAMRMIKL